MPHQATDLQITIRQGPQAGQTYFLRSNTITIGRQSNNQIVVNDPVVSRQHVRLVWQEHTFLLEDLGSANGTWVNEVRVTAPVELRPGDIIRLGQHIQLAYTRQAQTVVQSSNNRGCLLLSLGGMVAMMALIILILAGLVGYLWLSRPDEVFSTATVAVVLPENSNALLKTATSTTVAATNTPVSTATRTPKPKATSTSKPTRTPTVTPTPTVPPVIPNPAHNTLTFVDDFSNPESGWSVISNKNIDRYYQDGEFIFWIKTEEWATWTSGSTGYFTDFTFEADARIVEGSNQGQYGLVFRKGNNDNFYYFLIDCEGCYKIGKKRAGDCQKIEAKDNKF
jgi:hypothetical protein